MYSPLRALFLVLNLLGWTALVFLGTTSVVVPAYALPVAFPTIRDANYAHAPNASAPVFAQHVSPGTPRRDFLDSVEQLGAAGEAIQRRDINTVLGNINILNNYYVQMTQHASNFRELRAQMYRSMVLTVM